jgi:hypothetical protein
MCTPSVRFAHLFSDAGNHHETPRLLLVIGLLHQTRLTQCFLKMDILLSLIHTSPERTDAQDHALWTGGWRLENGASDSAPNKREHCHAALINTSIEDVATQTKERIAFYNKSEMFPHIFHRSQVRFSRLIPKEGSFRRDIRFGCLQKPNATESRLHYVSF